MQKTIEITKIYSNSNVRNEKDEDIWELAASIERDGLLNPLTVQSDGNGKYILIAGHRRLEALKKLGEPFAECNIIENSLAEEDVIQLQMIENVQRKDMSAYEIVQVFDQLKDKGMTNQAIARMFKKSAAWVQNNYTAVKMLEREFKDGIPEEKKKLSNGEIRAAHRRKQTGEAENIICKGMTVKRKGHSYIIYVSDFSVEKDLEEFINSHKGETI